MGRQGRAGAVVAVAALVAAALAACSVPREADLAASAPAASTTTAPATAATSATPTPTPTATPTVTPTVTPTPTVRPSPVKLRPPTPRALPGYSLAAAPRGLGDPLAAVRGAGDLFGAVTVKSVAKGDTPVGLLFLFAVRPQYVDSPRLSSLVLPKVVAGVTGGGLPVTMQRFGDQRVAVGTSAKKGTIVLWYSSGVLAVVVGGGDPAVVTGYARAYVAPR